MWRRGRFAWEYKGKHKDSDAAHRQLLQHAGALENPPLLVTIPGHGGIHSAATPTTHIARSRLNASFSRPNRIHLSQPRALLCRHVRASRRQLKLHKLSESIFYYWTKNIIAPTTIIAFMVMYVAWQQYILAKEKFKLDKYEKRYQLYEITRDFLDLIVNKNSIEIEDSYLEECETALSRLKFRKDDAIFIYNKSVHSFLVIIYMDGFAYLQSEKSFQRRLRDKPRGESMNNPRDLQRIRTKHEYKSRLITARQSLANNLSDFLVLNDAPTPLNFVLSFYRKLRYRVRKITSILNSLSVRYYGIAIFPLSNRSVIIIVLLEIFITICIAVLTSK